MFVLPLFQMTEPSARLQIDSLPAQWRIYQGTMPPVSKKPPVGASSGARDWRTVSAAPSSTVWVPLLPFNSVAVYPGLTVLTLIGVSRSSQASCTVIILRIALEPL